MSVKLTKRFISANGVRRGVHYHVSGDHISVYMKRGLYFPKEIASEVNITNNTEIQTDYFEDDRIILTPGDDLYDQAKAAVEAK